MDRKKTFTLEAITTLCLAFINAYNLFPLERLCVCPHLGQLHVRTHVHPRLFLTSLARNNIHKYMDNPEGWDEPLLRAELLPAPGSKENTELPTFVKTPLSLAAITPNMPREHVQTPRKEWEGSDYFCLNYSQFKTVV